MACCPCCCENKQGGTCCGEGDSAACCEAGKFCCDGVCQDTACDCEGLCDDESPCPAGCECWLSECVNPDDCTQVYFGAGWYTSSGAADFTALLQSAGYISVEFEAAEPYPGAGVPYEDGCGQTFWGVYAKCCGVDSGCTPSTTTGDVAGIVGPGNQFPPCGADTTNSVTIDTCCNPLP